MSQAENKTGSYLGLKLFAAALLATALLFAWSSSNYRISDQTQDTWIDDTGHLHVLGITIGRTTLRDAEISLKSRSDIALYIYPEEHAEAGLRLEAFFPSIADHSKVILELVADDQILKQIETRATLPHLYPNAVARMNVHPEDLPQIQQMIVKNLILIPSINISPEMLQNRFGAASTILPGDEDTTYYFFPEIGLKATLNDKDVTRLQFSNPLSVQ
ncbi:MAG: hypothetical protein AUJ57_08285 [Zetaproteobacteria bacterium CG1_02_53_45]|nr:MAG: hypothetical protein AUJ57_08285 [Zetaproteobacteria bacterium CG1_02_53_45]